MTAPSLFISHGAPSLAIRETAAHAFLKAFGAALDQVRAIVVVSAHFEADDFAVVADPEPETIHDFRGFPPELHAIRYPAPGAPDIAGEVHALLDRAGLETSIVARRGFDHGVWVPLVLMRPEADLPVVQIAVRPEAGPAAHHALGRALRPLREDGVMILGSGAATHNLHEFFDKGYALDAPPPDWVRAHGDWLAERIVAGDTESLLDYRARAPFAAENHPTEEHLLPLFVALGAGGDGGDRVSGQRLHTSHEYGVLMMDAYAFGA